MVLPRIATLAQTCGACPSQWEGRTAAGEHVYIRYRGGRLSLGIGPTEDDAVGSDHAVLERGDPLDGVMDTGTMIALLADHADFSEVA